MAANRDSFEFLEIEQKIAEMGTLNFYPEQSTKKLGMLGILCDEALYSDDLLNFAEAAAGKKPLEIPSKPMSEIDRLNCELMKDPNNSELLQKLLMAQLDM